MNENSKAVIIVPYLTVIDFLLNIYSRIIECCDPSSVHETSI